MTVGITLPLGPTSVAQSENAVDLLIGQAREAKDLGVRSVWLSQLFDIDALTTMAALAREVPDIALGTAAVPIYPRHPLVLANQAQTVQAASGGRFSLGIGLSAKPVAEGVYGVPYDRPIRQLREHLTVLRETVVPDGSGVPVLVAAMGKQALRAAADLADGCLPYLAGPRTLATRITPVITKRVVAAVPAVVTSNVDEVTAAMGDLLARYDEIPTYQRVVAAEGKKRAIDLALISDEKTVAAGIRTYFDAGATEVLLAHTGVGSVDDRRRTWALAAQ